MINLNMTMLIFIANVNGLNISIKGRERLGIRGKSNTQHYTIYTQLYTRKPLKI